MSKCDILLDNNKVSCGVSDELGVFHRKITDMLADGNDGTTWTMALDQQDKRIKELSNYGKEIKKESVVVARMKLTYLVNSIM